ncbi:MAG: hypothetical protein K5695_09560 [Oscillospiraceae bacterium]|nr:hypothetical protein [Oscillospiraceae bacterium]
MRIELNAGGLSNGAAISTFQSDFGAMAGRTRKMVQSFQQVRNYAYHMNGGVGILQDAVDDISARITQDEGRTEAIEAAVRKADDFVDLAKKVDKSVREIVIKNQDEFYRVNPWAKPPPPPEEKKCYQKAWDWCCKKVNDIKEGVEKAVDGFKDLVHNAADWCKESLGKAWKHIKDFCSSSIGKIVISVGIVAVLVVATVLTGGAAAVIFGMGAIGAGAGLVTGTIKGVREYAADKASGKGGNLLDSIANNMARDTVNGAASGLANGIGMVAGGVGARFVAGEILQVGSETVTGMWLDGKDPKQAFRDGAIKGTVSNTVDTISFGVTGGAKTTVPNGATEAGKNWAHEMVKDAAKKEAGEVVKVKALNSLILGYDSTEDFFTNLFTGDVHHRISNVFQSISGTVPAY